MHRRSPDDGAAQHTLLLDDDSLGAVLGRGQRRSNPCRPAANNDDVGFFKDRGLAGRFFNIVNGHTYLLKLRQNHRGFGNLGGLRSAMRYARQ